MSEQKDVLILGIESSCDETAASVIKNGREVLSNVISSQIDLHTLYGGVVPEIASRKHVERMNQVIEQALDEAGVTFEDITAIAVTYGPGLVGALLVGVAHAKALAFALGKPLVGVHHIEGHISANYIENKELEPPFMCLVVSGGHSHLVKVKDYGEYEILGRTRDDAAGEAFDKVARAIGLGYPGGPKIDKIELVVGDPYELYKERHKELTTIFFNDICALNSLKTDIENGSIDPEIVNMQLFCIRVTNDIIEEKQDLGVYHYTCSDLIDEYEKSKIHISVMPTLAVNDNDNGKIVSAI